MWAGITILIVGEGPDGRHGLARLLGESGLRASTEECPSIEEAQARLAVFHYDVVVLAPPAARRESIDLLQKASTASVPHILVVPASGAAGGWADVPGVQVADCLGVKPRDEAVRLLAQALQKAIFPGFTWGDTSHLSLVSQMFDSSSDGILVARQSGAILYANEAAGRLCGCPPGELVGQAAPNPAAGGLWVPRAKWADAEAAPSLRVTAAECHWLGEPAVLITLHPPRHGHETDFGSARLNEVVNQTGESVVITDLKGRIVYVNRGFERMTGYSFEEVKGRDPSILRGNLESSADTRQMWQAITAGQVWHGRFVNQRKDGSELIEDATVFAIRDAAGRLVNYAAVKRDVTEQVKMEQALQHSESRYALAARGAHDGLWEWDLESDEFYMAPRWKEMLGHTDDALEPSIDEWYNRVHPDDLAHLKAGLTAHLIGDTSHFQCEHRMRHKEGSYRWMLARGVADRGEGNRPLRMAGSITDITEKKVSEEQLLHQAWHDGLTNLINRATFIDRLRQRLTRAKWRGQWNFCALFIDLDRFKAVNDSLGHLAGDELLIELAKRMSEAIGKRDTLGRIGGDEFAVLIDSFADQEEPVRLARRLLAILDRPHSIQGRQFRISASIGIAYADARYQDAEHLLRDADTAMYQSKKRASGGFLVFEKPMLDSTLKSVEMEIDLHNAIEYNQLRAYYQPIVSIRTGRIVGFEALVRWDHPQLGFISPGEFIPIAEDTGLIIPIDLWVLRTAAKQVLAWQKDFGHKNAAPLFLSANLSPRHFSIGNSFEGIEKVLSETGFPASCLKLEITESMLLEQKEFALPLLVSLQKLGAQISLDDFGTGYSSLSYLHEFPVNVLKIDRSFVMQMVKQERARNIVRTILILAESLNIPVVAEGVETTEDLMMLRSLKCDYAQGFLFSRPVPAPEIEALLNDGTVW
ncbi:MAG: hypothetical protein PWP23_3199 [Candidatus Sumerlaeota bacterium]|nr:hypothetical protein [Candidatus Sumerlaeota bacterium]